MMKMMVGLSLSDFVFTMAWFLVMEVMEAFLKVWLYLKKQYTCIFRMKWTKI